MTSLRASEMEKPNQPAQRCETCHWHTQIGGTYGLGYCAGLLCQHYGHVLVMEHPGCRYYRRRRVT